MAPYTVVSKMEMIPRPKGQPVFSLVWAEFQSEIFEPGHRDVLLVVHE
jgi:hypothetical protein